MSAPIDLDSDRKSKRVCFVLPERLVMKLDRIAERCPEKTKSAALRLLIERCEEPRRTT